MLQAEKDPGLDVLVRTAPGKTHIPKIKQESNWFGEGIRMSRVAKEEHFHSASRALMISQILFVSYTVEKRPREAIKKGI